MAPLRDRRSDIPALAEHFLRRFISETGRKIRGFTPAALQKMQDYDWPGNVRELRNVVERAVALGGGPNLDAGDIWLSSLDVGGGSLSPAPARRRGKGPHPAHAAIRRVEQEPERDDPRHRALHAGSEDQALRLEALITYDPRSHAPRGNARPDAPRRGLVADGTQTVQTCVPTRERGNEGVGTRGGLLRV